MLVAKSCSTLCNTMDCSPPGSSVHGISHARILEWVAIPFFRRSSQPRDWNCGLLHCRWILYHLSHQGRPCICVMQSFFLVWLPLGQKWKRENSLEEETMFLKSSLFPFQRKDAWWGQRTREFICKGCIGNRKIFSRTSLSYHLKMDSKWQVNALRCERGLYWSRFAVFHQHLPLIS